MPRIKLTSAAVERLRPPKAGQTEHFDELLPSFGLRVSHSGTKAWFVMTRVDGKLIRVTLGRYPAVKLAEARKQAQEVMRLAAEGIDPRQVKEEKRRLHQVAADNTFGRLAEQFMAKHVEPNLRPTTAREYRRVLFGEDTARWRSRPVSSIKKTDILDLLDAIDARGAKTAGGLSLAYLRKFFSWCVEREVIETSPADRIKRGRKTVSRSRVLTLQELKLIWVAADAEGGLFGPIIKLLMLTGQRRNEVAGMRWDEIMGLGSESPTWEIPKERTKNKLTHLVPLSPQAEGVILSMPRLGPFIFSGSGATPASGFSKAKARIDRRIDELAALQTTRTVSQWRLHDLRRTMVTIMNEDLKVPPHVVEAVVNHLTGSAKAGVAGVYNRATYLDERRLALNTFAETISSIAAK